MHPLRERLSVLLLASAAASVVACGPPAKPNTPVRVNLIQASLTPTPVSDAQFAAAVGQLLSDGQRTPERLALLAGVVRHQFARAAAHFDAGDHTRGLQAVRGALYLVRAGELRPEMLDAKAARALEGAYAQAARSGEEGPALAFLHLRAASLPANDPEQARIAARLRTLADWVRDIRNDSAVENASADIVVFADQSMLEPGEQTLESARVVAERWISASLDFNANFEQNARRDRTREQMRHEMREAYRGMSTGALAVAGLYLRHGDAEGALRALEAQQNRRITSPSFYGVVQAAASTPDPGPWKDLASVYAKASNDTEDQVAVPAPIARGAAWGAVVEAFRRDPQAYDAARVLAGILPQLGLSEASPVVLANSVVHSTDPQAVSDSLQLVLAIMVQEDAAQDPASAMRIFNASQPLLSFADALRTKTALEPSPALVRVVMGKILVRAADLAAARPILEQAVIAEPSLDAFGTLAVVRLQANDKDGALDAVNKALAAPDARQSPLGIADVQLTAFQIHRSRGDAAAAREALGTALRQTLDARSRANNDQARAACERTLARIAYFYGDRTGWSRAIGRMFQYAATDRNALSLALIEATSTSLLFGDNRAAREALQKSMDGQVDDEDIAYAALWLQLAERGAGAGESALARDALSSVGQTQPWPSALALWGLGKIDDQGLLGRAKNVAQRTEASFYAAMRKRAAGDASAQAELLRIGQGPAIELVETHLARELTLPAPATAWGPPPVPLP